MLGEVLSVVLSVLMLACMYVCCVRICKCPTVCGTVGHLLLNLALFTFALATLEQSYCFLTGYEPIFTAGMTPPWSRAGALDELLGDNNSHLSFLRESRRAAKARQKAMREKLHEPPTSLADDPLFLQAVNPPTMQRFQNRKPKPPAKAKDKTKGKGKPKPKTHAPA